MIKSNVPLKFPPPDSIRYTCPANQNINLFYYVEFKPNWTVSLKCTWFCSMFWACTISGHICTTLDKFETTSSFLRLGLPSTLIRHGNGALWKRPINRWNLCWRKSWSQSFFENDVVTIVMWFPWSSFQSVIVAFLSSFCIVQTGPQLALYILRNCLNDCFF